MAKRPPNSTETLPNGSLIEYWDSTGLDGQPQQRRYMVDGKRLPSVSTVAKYLDPSVDGLLYWSAGLTCEGVAQLAQQSGSIDWINSGEQIKQALREAELTWKDVRDQAAQRGTNVHERIFAALSDRRTLPDLSALSAEERGYGQAAFKFWADVDPAPIMAEQMTAGDGFVGRFDLLAEIDGQTVLVDAKTRQKPSDRISDHVQLAGYRLALEHSGQPTPDRLLILILMPDGEYLEVEGEASDEDWLTALSAYESNRLLSKRMRDQAKARKLVAA